MSVQDIEFLTFIEFLGKDRLKTELDMVYKKNKEFNNLTIFEFGNYGIKRVAAAIALTFPYKYLEKDVLKIIHMYLFGDIGGPFFQHYLEEIIEKSPISKEAFNSACEILDTKHKWLEEHILAIGD